MTRSAYIHLPWLGFARNVQVRDPETAQASLWCRTPANRAFVLKRVVSRLQNKIKPKLVHKDDKRGKTLVPITLCQQRRLRSVRIEDAYSYFTSRASCSAWERRNGRGMVVRLDLDQRMQHLVGELPSSSRVIRGPKIGHVSLKYGSIVAISGDSEVRDFLVGVLDHLEETLPHGLAIDGPGRIEDFVPTMPVKDEWSEGEFRTRLEDGWTLVHRDR